MSAKLFVGGLSFHTDNEGLRRGFEGFGEVLEATVIMDRETGRSRGFGFVTLGNRSDIAAAIEGMDGKELDGRTVRVNEAREREPRSPSHGGGHGGGPPGGGSFDEGRPSSKGKSRRTDKRDRW
jgi:heterogeneous nuclear ribonucleoprotein A1/A3